MDTVPAVVLSPPFVPSEVEVRDADAAFGAGPSTSLGTNG